MYGGHQLPPHVSQELYELARVAYEGLLKHTYVFTDLGDDFGHLSMMKKTTSLDPSVGPECSFSFLHLTLQEYLASLYLALQPHSSLQVPLPFGGHGIFVRFLAGLCNRDDNLDDPLYQSVLKVLTPDFTGIVHQQVLRCAYECPSIMRDLEWVKHLFSSIVVTGMEHQLPVFDYYIIGYCINHFGGRWCVTISVQGQVDLLVKGLQSSPTAHGRIEQLNLGTQLMCGKIMDISK